MKSRYEDRRSALKAKIRAACAVDAVTGCWIWQGGHSGDGRGGGYGRVKIDGGTMATHIVMWVIEHGPIPPRKRIDHDCPGGPRRLCCNPAHLQMVTHKQNQRLRDKRRKMSCEAA